MLREMLVHFEHRHLIFAENLAKLDVCQRISRQFSGFCRLCERMYSQTLLTTSPRDKGLEPTTAASSSEGCSGFSSPLCLPLLVLFSRDFAGIVLPLSSGVAQQTTPARPAKYPTEFSRKVRLAEGKTS